VRLATDAGLGAADAVFALGPTCAVVVSDHHVGPLWGAAVAGALAYGGRPLGGSIAMPAGEEHKRLATVERLSESLMALRVDRRGALVAVGGGVVSDVTGLLAALYFRGVPWIAVPTTFLAMVDAAIGGKTGVDLADAKNVLGAFHPPRSVVVDPAQARTEPTRQVRSGLAEALKTALVGDPDLLDLLEREAERVATEPALWDEVVRRSLAVKIGVVTRDENELGERAHLNLGHTFGHAIEAAAGFGTLLHGEAVAIGLMAALEVGVALGVTERTLPRRVERILTRLGLPRSAPAAECARALELVGSDKKRRGATVGFVVVREPGRPEVRWEAIGPLSARLAAAAAR
jgi:3-dehydroquinate synthase